MEDMKTYMKWRNVAVKILRAREEEELKMRLFMSTLEMMKGIGMIE